MSKIKHVQLHYILYYTILYYTILYYTILYYTILYYTILYYTILYYTILYYTISIIQFSFTHPRDRRCEVQEDDGGRPGPRWCVEQLFQQYDILYDATIFIIYYTMICSYNITYMYVCMYVCMYIYIYIQRERERERERDILPNFASASLYTNDTDRQTDRANECRRDVDDASDLHQKCTSKDT